MSINKTRAGRHREDWGVRGEGGRGCGGDGAAGGGLAGGVHIDRVKTRYQQKHPSPAAKAHDADGRGAVPSRSHGFG